MSNDSTIGYGLDRYVAILDIFAGLRESGLRSNERTNGYGVTELSHAIGVSKGAMSRYLRRMEEVGILIRMPDMSFILASRVYHWGQAAIPNSDLRFEVNPVMRDLAHRFGETVSLFVLQSQGAVCIDQVDGIHPVRLNAAIGRQLPAHSGSSPRLLLAFASKEQQEAVLAQAPFIPLTPDTIVDRELLQKALVRACEDGYVVSIGESNEDVIGMAVPIRDVRRQVIAAISIAGPKSRLEGDRQQEVLESVRQAAAQISTKLGYLPDLLEEQNGSEGSEKPR